MPRFILKMPVWERRLLFEVQMGKSTMSQAVSVTAGDAIAFVRSQDFYPGHFGDLCCVIQHTRGDSESSKSLHVTINHAGMHSCASELIGAPEKLKHIFQSHVKPKHL